MTDAAHSPCPNCQRLALDVAFYRECQQFASDRAQRAEAQVQRLAKGLTRKTRNHSRIFAHLSVADQSANR